MSRIDYNSYKYLFLDRDGVINTERTDDYVKNTSELVFIEGAIEAVARLSRLFERIFIITNQRGIGKGIFSEADLEDIHRHMLDEIEKKTGKIDKIYHCPDVKDSSINRKPNIGMAFQAQCDFPEVNFEKSIFVGNSKSDILFGNKLGMLTVLVGNKYDPGHYIYKIINIYCENLITFANLMKTEKGQH